MHQKEKKPLSGRGIDFVTKWPSMNPTSGLGSYGRTRGAILLGGPRTSMGSQARVYAFEKRRGRGQEYQQYLLSVLGNGFVYKNAWSVIQ